MHPVVVSVDGRREFVPCGKCNFCLESRRSEWSFRLRQELKVSSSASFLTLTYEKTPVTEAGVETLSKRDLQLFFKRLRKASQKKLRYYAVGEYGTRTIRPHYHALLFNCETEVLGQVMAIWSHGHCLCGDVTDASIHYVTKYHVNKFGDYPGRAPPFVLMSRRPGIGSNYIDTHAKWHQEGLRTFTQVNGFKGRLPRFYTDKIFDEAMKDTIKSLTPSELVEYFKEIERLEKLGSKDAHSAYVERKRHAHDSVKHKENRYNKF